MPEKRRGGYDVLEASSGSTVSTFLTTVLNTGGLTFDAEQTQDGGSIAVGFTSRFGAGSNDILLTKFTRNGTLSWIKTLGNGTDDVGYSVCQTEDGGFIVAGYTNTFGPGDYDVVLAKLSSNGTSSWVKKVRVGAGIEYPRVVRQTQDGGFIFTGGTNSFGTQDVLLAKFFQNGTLSWLNTLNTGSGDERSSVEQTQDLGFIVTGKTNVMSLGNTGALLAKFLSDGTLSWTKVLQGTGSLSGYNVRQTQDSGFIVIGDTYNILGAEGYGILFAKLTSTGNLTWAKALGIGNNDRGGAVEQTEDGGYILTGVSNLVSSAGGEATLIAKFSSNGTLSWATTLAFYNLHFYGIFIKQTEDGGFMIAGGSGLFLAKVNQNGMIIGCNATQAANLTVMDITHLINVTSISPTVTSSSPTVLDWPISAVSQNLNQTMICFEETQSKLFSHSFSHSLQSQSPSSRVSFSRSLSDKSTDSKNRTHSRSLTDKNTDSKKPTHSHSLRNTEDQTSSLSPEVIKTRTPHPTLTRPVRLGSAVLLQASDLAITGIMHLQISLSGSLVLAQTSTGLQLITVNQNSVMTEVGQFVLSGTIRAITFSQDEQYLFVANNQSIQVIDISNPHNLLPISAISTEAPIESLNIGGSGQHLLVGTNTGITVFSATTPATPATMTVVTSYPTSSPVKSIQTNPNTNVVVIGSGNNVTLLNFENNEFTLLDQKTFTNPVKTISPIDFISPTQLTLTLNNGDTVFMNIANPRSTIVISTIPGSPTELTTVSGATLLVAGVKPGIQIFQNNQQNWQTIREVGYSPVVGSVSNLLFSENGGFAIYSDNQGLKLIKVIQHPGRLDVPLPRLLDVVDLNFAIRDVLLNEEHDWLVIGGRNQLTFISRENLQLPTILSVFNTVGNVQQLMFFPDKAKLVVIDGGGIAVVDCFNPAFPRELGRWSSVNTIYSATLSGSHVYVCQGAAGISVLDITNLANITKITTLSTQAAVYSIQFNQDHSLGFVADSTGIAIYSVQTPTLFQFISRFNSVGSVSNIALSSDEQTLYFISGEVFGRINIANSSMPLLSNYLDASRPIKNIVLSSQGIAAYLADETAGMLIINTETMQIQGQLPGTAVNAMALTEAEDEIYIADMDGGLKVVELINELPIIPLTARTHYPVGIRVEETLLFFDQTLNPIATDRINSIQYINNGQQQDLPFWISADLTQRKLFITAPAELTDQFIQLAISLIVDGVSQVTLYQAQVSSSLAINLNRGVIAITTPSPMVSVNVNLTQAIFIPQSAGALSVSIEGNTLQLYGPVGLVNNYLQSVRVIPNPATLDSSVVALNSAQVQATDTVNRFSSVTIVPLRSFRFDQPPVVMNRMSQMNEKALNPFQVSVPSNIFSDPDDLNLRLSAQLVNGTQLPSWLTFNTITAAFSGEAPVAMLGKSLEIEITATDGYLSANTTWLLHIDPNHGPFVATPIPSLTRESGVEFFYTLPKDTFRDDDNNTLTANAVQEGYDVLPGFLTFDPKSDMFLGRPTANDVNTYNIKITKTDKFGASAAAIMSLSIKYSNWDLGLYALNIIGYLAPFITVISFVYYSRSFLYNTVTRKNYWHDEIPADLLEGKDYKSKINKDNITKIRIMMLNPKNFGHDFAKNKLPLHWYITFFAKALLNDELLPPWLKLDHNTRTLTLKPEHFPIPADNKIYLCQLIEKSRFIGDIILESFFIDLAKISMYQAPIVTPQLSSSLDPSIELPENRDPDRLSNVLNWVETVELVALPSQPVIASTDSNVTLPHPATEGNSQQQISLHIESESSDDENPLRHHEGSPNQHNFFYGIWSKQKRSSVANPLLPQPKFEL